jgi:tryptophan synthase alpha chain
MANRIDDLFRRKKEKVLSVYFTAGFPQLNDTATIIQSLQQAGCDMIEIGIPFSDPLADGPVIQHSSTMALQNSMNVKTLFSQLKGIRQNVHIPLILMGYMNPVLQYGFERFCKQAQSIGIDGLIIPDLPPEVFEKQYKFLFEANKLHNIILITPRTDEARVRYIEQAGSGFIYAVASSSTTGSVAKDKGAQLEYFSRIKNLHLKLPVMAGFGISNREQFLSVCNYMHGGIIGTSFIKHIEQHTDLETSIESFIQSILI